MNTTLRCSVIIPTHNCLDLLPIALASVKMQEIDDIEVLVVDDASTDGTWQWLAEATKDDPRIVALQGGGVGPSRARNFALDQSHAPFVAFLDADDMWWPGKLSRALSFHEANPEVSFSFTDYLHVDPRGEVRGTCFDFWQPGYVDRSNLEFRRIADAELELLAANVVGTSTVIASRASLQNANGFAGDSLSAEDWDLWLRLAAKGPVACSAASTATYLMRPNSVTQNRSRRIEAMRKIIDRYAARPEARGAVRRALARIDIAEAERARALGQPLAAARAHISAFTRWPSRRTARAAAADLVAACRSTP